MRIKFEDDRKVMQGESLYNTLHALFFYEIVPGALMMLGAVALWKVSIPVNQVSVGIAGLMLCLFMFGWLHILLAFVSLFGNSAMILTMVRNE